MPYRMQSGSIYRGCHHMPENWLRRVMEKAMETISTKIKSNRKYAVHIGNGRTPFEYWSALICFVFSKAGYREKKDG